MGEEDGIHLKKDKDYLEVVDSGKCDINHLGQTEVNFGDLLDL